jgi:hypothetical protein
MGSWLQLKKGWEMVEVENGANMVKLQVACRKQLVGAI